MVQSGCTRRATAEHSAEIIHQFKQGTAELLRVEEQNRYTHKYVHAHTYMYIHPQYTIESFLQKQMLKLVTRMHIQTHQCYFVANSL